MVNRLRTKQDYIDAGVEPPERIVHHGSDQRVPDNHTHAWEVRGSFLHCSQGQHGHGIPYDHLNQIFVGTAADGTPLFKPVTLANKDEHEKYLADQAKADIIEGNAPPSE